MMPRRMLDMSMARCLIFIFFLCTSAVSIGAERSSMVSSLDCGIYDNFIEYKKWLRKFPKYTAIKQSIDLQEFIEVAKATSSKKNWLRKIVNDNESLQLRTEAIIWRTVWVDNRIRRIIEWREVCKNKTGELLLLIDDGSGKEKTDIVTFKKIRGHWLRGAPFISNTSEILGISVKDALKDKSNVGYDFGFE